MNKDRKPEQHIKWELINHIDKLQKHLSNSKNTSVLGLSTGLVDLDEFTTGLYPSQLIIFGGRTGMGKTALAMSIANHVALNLQKNVFIFSAEKSPDFVAQNLLSALARVDNHSLKNGCLDDDQWPKLSKAVELLSEAPVYVDHCIGDNIEEICVRARELSLEVGNPGLIIVDYIQILARSSASPENRTAEISAITRHLKTLAKELNTPIIALSQINRNVEQRDDQRPRLTDLRDSGSIEEDADIVGLLYRDEHCNLEMNIAKHRDGSIGKIRFDFISKFGLVENFDPTMKIEIKIAMEQSTAELLSDIMNNN
jgi:replicative DNA helicase